MNWRVDYILKKGSTDPMNPYQKLPRTFALEFQWKYRPCMKPMNMSKFVNSVHRIFGQMALTSFKLVNRTIGKPVWGATLSLPLLFPLPERGWLFWFWFCGLFPSFDCGRLFLGRQDGKSLLLKGSPNCILMSGIPKSFNILSNILRGSIKLSSLKILSNPMSNGFSIDFEWNGLPKLSNNFDRKEFKFYFF